MQLNQTTYLEVFAPVARDTNALIAQLVEQLPFKETVPGSNPGEGTLARIK